MQFGRKKQNRMNLENKVVIVTGGGTGIGRATALLFVNHGAKLVLCGRRMEPLKKTVRLIHQNGGHALAGPCDVRDNQQVVSMVEKVINRFGDVDILINNAGIAYKKAVGDHTEEEWDEVLATNLKAVFLCCRAVLPSMLKVANGIIVNVSSTLGMTGIANMTAYCASKFGVIGFTQALADELKQKGIRVYAACPGSTNTTLHRRVGGEEVAKLSMPPEKVGAKIIELVTGKISLPSGGTLIVDAQSDHLSRHTTKAKLHQLKRYWIEPALPLLRRIKKLVT
ncbi:MAG: SDR family NAD(P)-dependent oxidoreductase [bacterium]